MRTTVNIDPRLLAEAKETAARDHRSLSDVIDDALRMMFALRATRPGRSMRVTLPTAGTPGGRTLIDVGDKEALAEALGDNEAVDAAG